MFTNGHFKAGLKMPSYYFGGHYGKDAYTVALRSPFYGTYDIKANRIDLIVC